MPKPISIDQVLKDEWQEICAELELGDDPGRAPVALCLSGGGIRSATFALGVLQGLARWPRRAGNSDALSAFDYLSTVSGGGYIGSWLSRRIRVVGMGSVVAALASDTESDAIRHLRSYSNYLAPKRGLSTDGLTLASIVGRNLTLNWLVMLPTILLTLLVPRIALLAITVLGEGGQAVAGVGIVSLIVGLGLTIYVVQYTSRNIPPGPDGDSKAAPFAIYLPIAAVCWAIAWAALSGLRVDRLSNGEPDGLGAFVETHLYTIVACLGLGVVGHVVGGFWGGLVRWPREETDLGAGPSSIGPTRNAFVGLAVVGTGLMAGAMLFAGTLICPKPSDAPIPYVVFAVPYLLATYWFATILYAGIVGLATPGEDGEASREWWGRAGAVTLKPLLVWLVVACLVLYGPCVLAWLGSWAWPVVATGGLGGLVSALIGLFGRAGLDDRDASVPSWKARLQDRLLPVLASTFLVVLVVVISLGSSAFLARREESGSIVLWTGDDRAQAMHLKDKVRENLDDQAVAAAFVDLATQKVPEVLANQGRAKETTRDSEFATSVAREESLHEAPDGVGGSSGATNFDGRTVGDTPAAAIASAAGAEVQDLTRRKIHESLASPIIDFGELRKRHEDATGNPLGGSSGTRLVGLIGASLCTLLLGWVLAGVNRFSLHAMYGNRLIRAYLGGRPKRRPNGFSDFDPYDDEPIKLLKRRPLQILNLALNAADAKGEAGLARQSRRAIPFSVSRLYSGSAETGFQQSAAYGGEMEGITLGRAMTISGAAVSPAMGYHSSTPVGAVMTLFNARLGWWLPNPSREDPQLLRRSEPTAGVFLLFREALGMTSAASKWIQLSDGGHLDNLGLYEMIRRRCGLIVVVDATQDPHLENDDLVRVMRLVRADFGASIAFPGGLPSRDNKRHYAIGTIEYPAQLPGVTRSSGVIVYIKPVLTGDEPVDVRHYQQARARVGERFPHQSTGDQFFDEAQFESYRVLGLHSVESLMRDFPDFDEIRSVVRVSLQQTAISTAAEAAPQVPSAGPAQPAESWFERLSKLGAPMLAPAAVSTVMATTLAVTVAGTVPLMLPSGAIPIQAPGPVELKPAGPVHLSAEGAQVALRVDHPLPVAVTLGAPLGPIYLPGDSSKREIQELNEKFNSILEQLDQRRRMTVPQTIELDPATEKLLHDGIGLSPAAEQTLRAAIATLTTQTETLKDIKTSVDTIGPRRNVRGGGG